MEKNLSPLKKIITRINDKLNSNESLTAHSPQRFLNLIKSFQEDNTGKKVNLTVIGNISVGKTTLINLMIRHLITQATHQSYNPQIPHDQSALSSNSNNPLNDEEDDEEVEGEKYDGFVELSTREVENTYFVSFIENSDSEQYQIIIEVSIDEDKQALNKLEAFKNHNFNVNNQIIFRFANNENEIKMMNKFLKDLDFQCFNIIRNRKKVDLDDKQLNQKEFIPSKMIIKIPGFPKEYRLIDSPGLSTKSFRKALMSMIYDLNSVNFFLIVNDIYLRESYSITDEILKEVVKDYGSPIVYYFFTKGNKFLDEFPKINKNYNAYVRTNHCLFKNLEEIKSKLNFRKVLPINDKIYNDDVKNSLKVFFDDLDKIRKEYGLANYEDSVFHRLRKELYDINNRLGKECLSSEDQMKSLKDSAEKGKIYYEQGVKEYFDDLSDFNTFKNKYPDLLEDLNEVYDKHEWKNDSKMVRSNYIKKHIDLSFDDFQKIILKKPQALVIAAFDKIDEKISEDVENNILRRHSAEGLENGNSENVKIRSLSLFSAFILLGAISIIAFKQMGNRGIIATNGFLYDLGILYVPVAAFILGGLHFVNFLSPVIGLWSIKDTRDDITKALLEWLNNSKEKIINDSLERLEEKVKIQFENMNKSKVPEEGVKDLLSDCDEFKPNNKSFSITNHKEEFLSIIEKPRLKNFFTRVFDYKEEEQSD